MDANVALTIDECVVVQEPLPQKLKTICLRVHRKVLADKIVAVIAATRFANVRVDLSLDRRGGLWVFATEEDRPSELLGVHVDFKALAGRLELTTDDFVAFGTVQMNLLGLLQTTVMTELSASFKSAGIEHPSELRSLIEIEACLQQVSNLSENIGLNRETEFELVCDEHRVKPRLFLNPLHIAERFQHISASSEFGPEMILKYLRQLFAHRHISQLVDATEGLSQTAMKSSLLVRSLKATHPDLKAVTTRPQDVAAVVGELLNTVVDAESNQVLSFQIPLLLAAVWSDENPDHAFDCLIRFTEQNGLTRYTLAKIAALRGADKTSLVLRLKTLEETLTTLSSRRLLDIFRSRLIDDPEQGYQVLRTQIQHTGADLACDLQLIEECRRLKCWDDVLGIGVPLIDRAEHKVPVELLNAVADAWIHGYGRQDVALELLELSLEINPRQPEVVRHLASLYREGEHADKVSKMLQHQFTDAVEVFTARLSQNMSAFVSAGDLSSIDLSELAHALEIDAANADWRVVFQEIKNIMGLQVHAADLGPMHAILGHIAIEKLNDTNLAVTHFLTASHYGFLDLSRAQLVREVLLNSGRLAELLGFDCQLLDLESDDRKPIVLRELLNLPLSVDADKKLDWVLALIRLSVDDQDVALKYAVNLVNDGDFSRLETMLKVLSSSQVIVNFCAWIEVVIEEFERRSIKNETLTMMFHLLFEMSDDKPTVAHRALSQLIFSQDTAFRKRLVMELIEADVVPQITASEVATVLEGDDRAMARFYLLQVRHGSADASQLVNSLRHLDSQGVDRVLLIEVIYSLGQLQVVEPRYLALVRSDAMSQSSWQPYLELLNKQLEITKNAGSPSNSQLVILEEIAKISTEYLRDHPAAITVFRQMIELTDRPVLYRSQLIDVLIAHEDFGGAFVEIQNAMRDLTSYFGMESLSRILHAAKASLDTEQVRTVLSILESQFAQLEEDGEYERLGEISSLLIELDLGAPQLRKYAIIKALLGATTVQMAEMISTYLLQSQNPKALTNNLSWIRRVFGLIELSGSYEETCAAMVEVVDWNASTRSPVIDHLVWEILRVLSKSDVYASDAVELIQKLDTSRWMSQVDLLVPLYIVLRDFAAESDIQDYLRRVLPILKTKPELLLSYPFTIQSLEAAAAKKLPLENSSAPERGEASVSRLAALSWRKQVAQFNFDAALKKSAFEQRYSNDLERHIALQALALGYGDYGLLNEWQWQVWRYPDHFGYPLTRMGRASNDRSLDLIMGPLHQFLLALQRPLYLRYRKEFGKDQLVKRLNQREGAALGKPISLDDRLIRQSNLVHLVPMLMRRNISLVDITGLGQHLHYDGEHRTVSLDAEYYAEQPCTHLFHRLSWKIEEVKARYFIFLQLDPEVHIMPFIKKVEATLNENLVDKTMGVIADLFADSKTALAGVAWSEIQALRQSLGGEITGRSVAELLQQMRRHIVQKTVAESLDVIGTVEALAGVDVLSTQENAASLAKLNPEIAVILRWVATLKFRQVKKENS